MTYPKFTSLVKDNGDLNINLPGSESHAFSRTSWTLPFCTNHGNLHGRNGKGFLFGHLRVPIAPLFPSHDQIAGSSLDIYSKYRLTCPLTGYFPPFSYTKEAVLENIYLLKTFLGTQSRMV